MCHSQISKIIFNIEMVKKLTPFLFSYSSDIQLSCGFELHSFLICAVDIRHVKLPDLVQEVSIQYLPVLSYMYRLRSLTPDVANWVF